MGKKVVVVGAGLGGLVCARRLSRLGHDIAIFEREDRIGGRLKTDVIDGFRIDRGFRPILTAYPYLSRELDLRKLDLKFLATGARIRWDGRLREVRLDRPLRMLFSTFFDYTDKFRMKGYTAMLSSLSPQQVWLIEDRSILEELRLNGLEGAFIERFAKPFFGSFFLNRSLETSHRAFRYFWKMLTDGRLAVPALGMEEIPKQVANDLPQGAIQCLTPVQAVSRSNGTVNGIILESGEEVRADAVVIATDSPSTQPLLPGSPSLLGESCTVLTFDAPRAPFPGAELVLNGDGAGLVSHLCVLSNVSPESAPPGKALVSVTVLGIPGSSDEELASVVKSQLADWFPGMDVEHWRALRIDRIPFAMYSQTVGFGDQLPSPKTEEPGLFLAGEQTTFSSIDGACLSGAQTAALVNEFLEQS